MEGEIVRYGSFPAIICMICFSFLNGVVSEVYTVGDENGWNSEVDYASWSEKYNFTVGDVLEFRYSRGQHNAYEVTESAYRTCETSSGVLGKYESGEDKVELNESKKYWFVCNVSGHCLRGMRFGVDVKETTIHLDPIPSPNSACTNRVYFYLPLTWFLHYCVSWFAIIYFVVPSFMSYTCLCMHIHLVIS
ncbi:mavicyanin-like [Hibiscus syriacus]|uniref:mavicyanin-like n=1 Tax=Hibiscus syriacus TaxID=106335 RepID=UPI0019239266|nr:mavicyanin-like [Hibiscus syriacus]